MLASLLPGLRHLRAPLASGYITLFGLWLLIRPLLPPPNGATGPLKDALDLADYSGKPAVLVASGFTAYLIGTLIVAATDSIFEFFHFIRRRWDLDRYWFVPWISPGKWQDSKMQLAVTDAVVNKLSKRYLEEDNFRTSIISHVSNVQARASDEQRALNPLLANFTAQELERVALQDYYTRHKLLSTVVATGAYIESTDSDLPYVAQRLLGREDALYGEYDRERAEATFLSGLILPLAFALIILAFRSSPWWLIGLLAPFSFIWLTVAAWTNSTVNLARALAADRVETPALERLLNIDIELMPYERLVDSNIDGSTTCNTSNTIATSTIQTTLSPNNSSPEPGKHGPH